MGSLPLPMLGLDQDTALIGGNLVLMVSRWHSNVVLFSFNFQDSGGKEGEGSTSRTLGTFLCAYTVHYSIASQIKTLRWELKCGSINNE